MQHQQTPNIGIILWMDQQCSPVRKDRGCQEYHVVHAHSLVYPGLLRLLLEA